MTDVDTRYVNTDLDLLSPFAFDVLHTELAALCCPLHYAETANGTWSACYEANQLQSDAPNDIGAFLAAIAKLSDSATAQLAACTKRDFNVGFDCWDSWGFNYAFPLDLLTQVANAGFSISITLYPMRKTDGTPRLDPDKE
ncbi:hypothetical protein Pan241w_50220 [Gimesia alba]|uniref:DUF4279 domain-containing protein n=1 Tax=Gimesia alba TaxID=2527973 RepID=A0A517RLZ9_9PLAN|nr:hypothetical protein [Gimesia alba]QDT44906.1 hypothetical protein Pan241w_50220 [Gimesia alba]